MKAIIPNFDENAVVPMYLQLYQHIKQAILQGEIRSEERLPSLRTLAKNLKLSLTTVESAYSQLLVEGYIYSKPQSGYYANRISAGMGSIPTVSFENSSTEPQGLSADQESHWPESILLPIGTSDEKIVYHDPAAFDFNKWKKCMNKVLTEYAHLLLREGDPKGEAPLRGEIARYVYQSRGVVTTPDQIVIGAGTQQITGQLCTILHKMGINHVSVEEPGYLPVRNIFRDRSFLISTVPVDREGIRISRLPANIRSVAYVNPSNQFPTSSVMPIGKRYELLHWAEVNDSVIIEDDYDSELRYFGKPIPSLQGLDSSHRVVYLGSFSSTLFPSIKISYMVLPPAMTEIFDTFSKEYTQTCSKTEQLTLALYMNQGLYQINIKKLRTLYGQKIQAVLSALSHYGAEFIESVNSSSGINMLIKVKSGKTSATLCHEAAELGIVTIPIDTYTDASAAASATLIFYYNQIPLNKIDLAVRDLTAKWRKENSPQ